MNPGFADNHMLPQPAMVTLNQRPQPAFRIVRPLGGIAELHYIAEASFDLQAWTLPTVLLSTDADTPRPGLETQTMGLDNAFLPLVGSNQRIYFRLKVQRR